MFSSDVSIFLLLEHIFAHNRKMEISDRTLKADKNCGVTGLRITRLWNGENVLYHTIRMAKYQMSPHSRSLLN